MPILLATMILFSAPGAILGCGFYCGSIAAELSDMELLKAHVAAAV